MARPAKSTRVKTGTITKKEEAVRAAVEDSLRGGSAELNPPDYLSDDQKEVFYFIVEKLAEADILSSLDEYALCQFAIATSRLRQIEKMVNDTPEYLFDATLMGARTRYSNDFWKGCSEFCLSPQARAKIGSLAAQAAKAKEDPLLKVLENDD
jgi:phage terminase, small subunit|nr:MAG TPA: terminase small subunit [Bacteriophage sp.]